MKTTAVKALVSVGVVVGLSALPLGTAAFAAKGGSGGRGSPSSSASLTASPNPVAAGGSYNLTGCGYTAAQVNITITEPATSTFSGATYFFGTPTSSGCINALFWADNTPGESYSITASQTSGKRQVLMASTSLAVQ